MPPKVKTKKQPKKDDSYLSFEGIEVVEGEVVEQDMPAVVEQIEKETGLSKERHTFHEMTTKQLKHNLEKFIKAVNIIKEKMINGVHYLEISGIEKPIITKQGTAWLAAATGMTMKIEEVKEIIEPDKDLILYQHKATVSWGDSRAVSAMGSANSQEYNQKRKFEEQKSQKTVFDVINDVIQMSQKRAKSQAIKEMIAMTDIFETNEDNPLANKRKQMGIYTIFYKAFMQYAPDAPKKTKLKNGKWKFYNEKEKLNWQKDYLKNKYFTPQIYKLGLPTYGNWGIKDVEQLEKEIPLWPKKIVEMSEYDKELANETKNSKT